MSVSVIYKLTYQEYRRAYRSHLLSSPVSFAIRILMLWFVMFQPIFMHGNIRWIDWGIMALLYMAMVLSTRKAVTKLTEQTVTLSEDGVTLESDSGMRQMYWKVIPRLRTTREFLFIYVNTNSVVMIPKRAFSSVGDRQEFERVMYQYWNEVH